MKKILVVLLILSVAWGVFAQEGSWSIGADAMIGTRLDFDPVPGRKVEGEKAVTSALAWEGWNQPHAGVSLNYTKGGLATGLNFTSRVGETDASVNYRGEGYQFASNIELSHLVGLGSGQGGSSVYPIKRLWGRFDFLNGVVPVMVALDSYDNGDGDWTSNKWGVIRNPRQKFYAGQYVLWNDGGFGDSFAKFDHPNLLMAKVKLDNLDFGVQVRNLFNWVGPANGGGRYETYASQPRIYDPAGTMNPFDPDVGTPVDGKKPYHYNLLVDEVLKKSVIGAKFNMAPLEFAAQFKLEQYGVYFGGKFITGPVTAGLSFMGLLGDENAAGQKTATQMQFGGSIDYNAGAFGGGVGAYYKRDQATATTGDKLPIAGKHSSLIAVHPNFFINAIPSHLRFYVETGFYFINDYFDVSTKHGNDTIVKNVVWAVEPAIIWNFKGTGAASGGGLNTGVLARYRVVSYDAVGYEDLGYSKGGGANFLDVVFKWGL